MKGLIKKVNVTRVVCNHLVGEGHTEGHRMITGAIIIIVGVGISKVPTSIHAIHWVADAVGFGIHALGCVPFIERFLSASKTKNAEKEETKEEGEE